VVCSDCRAAAIAAQGRMHAIRPSTDRMRRTIDIGIAVVIKQYVPRTADTFPPAAAAAARHTGAGVGHFPSPDTSPSNVPHPDRAQQFFYTARQKKRNQFSFVCFSFNARQKLANFYAYI